MIVFLVGTSDLSLEYSIDRYLEESLYNSSNVKKVGFYSLERAPSAEKKSFFTQSIAEISPGGYVFFYRNDGSSRWEGEHLLLKYCEKTGRFGTVFAEGAHISMFIECIGGLTEYLILEDENMRI